MKIITLFFLCSWVGVSMGAKPKLLREGMNCTDAIYYASKGSIIFPHTNEGEGPGTHCHYTFNITHEVSQNVSLLPIIFLNIQTAVLAPDDHLEIFDGIKTRSYSGILKPFMLLIQRHLKSYIDLTVSTSTDVQRKLTIVYSAESCVVNYQMGPEVTITTPIYSVKEDQSFNCTWIITAARGYEVYMQFSEFQITTGNVTVTGSANAPQPYSGNTLPDDAMSVQSNLRIFMIVAIKKENEMFTASYFFVDRACSSSKEIKDQNLISLPGQANSLQATCVVVLKVADVRMRIVGVINGSSVNESYGVMSVYDGNMHSHNLVMFFTSKNSASYFVSSGPRIALMYTQFGGNARAQVNITIQSAGGYYEAGVVEIAKPSDAKENSTLYSLFTAKDKFVRIAPIGNIILPENCTITAYEKDERSVVARFTGNKLFEVMSMSNNLLLDVQNFHVDPVKFNFTEVLNECSGYGYLNRSTFYILNKKEYLGPCTYTIHPSEYHESDAISLHVSSVSLAGSDRVAISEDGKEIVSWNQSDFVTGSKLIYGSASTGITLQFHPDKTRTQATGNVLSLFYSLHSDCGGVINVSNGTKLTSPRYPNTYPLNAKCNWTLVAPENKTLLLSFKTISLNLNNSLRIHELRNGNDTVLFNFTVGDTDPDDILTVGNVSSVIFQIPPTLKQSQLQYGFELEVNIVDCGRGVKGTSGHFETPNYPSALNGSMFCVWIVEVPEKSEETSQIIHYTSETIPASNLTYGIATFHDGASTESPQLSQERTLTGRNKLLVTYSYVHDTYAGAPFQVTFQAADCASLCKTGICMRDTWRCNHVNDCGDNSDEIDCLKTVYNGVTVTAFVVTILAMLTIGIAVGFFTPRILHRIKNPRHYQEFRPTGDE